MMDFDVKKKHSNNAGLDLISEKESVNELLNDSKNRIVTTNVQDKPGQNKTSNEVPRLMTLDDDNSINKPFVPHPVPHLSGKLDRAIRKVIASDDKAFDSIKQKVDELRRADTESVFTDSLIAVIKESIIFLDTNQGVAKNQKDIISSLLNEIAEYSATGAANIKINVNSCANEVRDNSKYGKLFKENFNYAFRNHYRRLAETKKVEELAEEEKSKIKKDISENGGSCSAWAKKILENRQNGNKGENGNSSGREKKVSGKRKERTNSESPEFKFNSFKLKIAIENIFIPDTESMDDYELLSFGGIEKLRKEVYIPLSQNLERLISTGEINNTEDIQALRIRMETLKMELDLYDVRLNQMAEKLQSEFDYEKLIDANNEVEKEKNDLTANNNYLKDLEDRNMKKIEESMKYVDCVNKYKEYKKIIFEDEDISENEIKKRQLIFEQNRARKEYFTNAAFNCMDTKLKSSQEKEPLERCKEYRNECDRILSEDYSVLFDTRFDYNGMLEDCTKRMELINMLGSLDSYIKEINDFEKKLSENDKKAADDEHLTINNMEMQQLSLLASIGSDFNQYMNIMESLMNNSSAYSILSFSDFENLTGEKKEELRNRLSETGKDNPFAKNLLQAFNDFDKLSDIRTTISANFGHTVNVIKDLKKQNDDKKRIKEEKAKAVQREEEERRKIEEEEIKKRKEEERKKREEEERKQREEEERKRIFSSVSEAIKKSDETETQKKTVKDSNDFKRYIEGLSIDDTIEHFRKNEIERRKKADIKNAIASYDALSNKDAKQGDEVKARELCVKIMAELTDKTEAMFDFIPTDIIAGLLKKINLNKKLDVKPVKDEVTQLFNESDYWDLTDIEKVLKDLCKNEDLNVSDSFKKLEFSIYAIDSTVERDVTDRKALEKFGVDYLSKLALMMIPFWDVDWDKEEEKPSKEDIAKIVDIGTNILSLMSGKDANQFKFIPPFELRKLVYEAVGKMETKEDIPAYIEEQRLLEKRKKEVRDGLKAYERIDKRKAKESDLNEAREIIVETLSTFSEKKKEDFDLLPTEILYGLLKESMGDVSDAEKLKNSISEKAKKADEELNVQTIGNSQMDILNDKEMSEAMKKYLIAEYNMNVYIKNMNELGIGMGMVTGKAYDSTKDKLSVKDSYSSRSRLSRKNFDLMKGDYLHDAILMGEVCIENNLDSRVEDASEGFREKMSEFLEGVTLKVKESLETIPIQDPEKLKAFPVLDKEKLKTLPVIDLKNMAYSLMNAAKDKDAFEKTIEELYSSYENRYKSENIVGELTQLMEQAKNIEETQSAGQINPALRDLKEVAIHYLVNFAGEKNISRKELELLPGMMLYTLVYEDATRKKDGPEAIDLLLENPAEKINNNEEKIEDLQEKKRLYEKVKKSLQEEKQYQTKSVVELSLERENLMARGEIHIDKRITSDRLEGEEWSDNEKDTLSLLGDIISEVPIQDKHGNTVKKADRVRTILMNNADLIKTLLNQRTVQNDKNGVVSLLGKRLPRGGNRLFDSINQYFLQKVFDRFVMLAGKTDEKTKEFTTEEVKEILNSRGMKDYLSSADAMLNAAIVDGEKTINTMISEAAENLFGEMIDMISEEDLYEKLPGEAVMKDAGSSMEDGEQRARIELTDEEKLARMRDSVFDPEKNQGKFLKLVIKDYYNKAPIDQKRFMMSYLIKDLKPTQVGTRREQGASFFASMLKGAGPLMQKLFQGIPEKMLMKQFRPALSIVKSDLRDIPPEYVDKQLLELKKNANDNLLSKKSTVRVTKITKRNSLGAASIAQTFLCDVQYTDKNSQKQHTETVVVKIKRPDVDISRLEREKTFIENCAKQTDTTGVMLASFYAHYKKIMEELDFNNELRNAEIGKSTYESNNVKSVSINKNIPSGKNYLVMNKAEGMTADHYIEELKSLSDNCLNEFRNYGVSTDKKLSTTYKNLDRRNKVRKQVADKLMEAQKCRKNMEELVKNWIEKALFEPVKRKQYFHHGDLHSGNIMINKDYATVLDYGNCTILDNNVGFFSSKSGKVSCIIRMMAAAFAGITDDFTKYLEQFIDLDGEQNDYNKLDKEKKDKMTSELKKHLDVIFKMGGNELTGERIFVALLKAQEVGFKLPQEMLNFSQCQQRLENSLIEFNNAIENLRETLNEIDTMDVAEFVNKTGDSEYEPVAMLLKKMSMSTDSKSVATAVKDAYASYRSIDRDELKRQLEDPTKSSEIRKVILRPCFIIKKCFDNKPDNRKITGFLDKVKNLNKDFKRYASFKNVRQEEISDKDKAWLGKMKSEIANLTVELLKISEVAKLIGGLSMLSGALVTASTEFDQESWDEFYSKVSKITAMYEIAIKFSDYETVLKKSKGKMTANLEKRAEALLDSLCGIVDENALSSRDIQDLEAQMANDLTTGNFLSCDEKAALNTLNDESVYREGGLLSKITVTTQEGSEEVYQNGKKAEYLQSLWNQYLELEKEDKPSEDQKQKKTSLLKKAGRVISIIHVENICTAATDSFENNLKEYFSDGSAEGKTFSEAFKKQRELQKTYIEERYKAVISDATPDAGLADLKNARVRANKEFLRAFRKMAEKRIKPIYDCYKDYESEEGNNFVEIMEKVLLNHKTQLATLFGFDITKYKTELK